jgi:hypothetical protein
MKWKNLGLDTSTFFITATITEWLPLLSMIGRDLESRPQENVRDFKSPVFRHAHDCKSRAIEVGNRRSEFFYYNSVGCIILHRADLLDLKDKWQRYVLLGASHGSLSVGLPLEVGYTENTVTDPNPHVP